MRKTWRCFFCDEVFTSAKSAAEHFGTEMACEPEAPACKLNEMEGGILRLYREALAENRRLMDEDSPSYREFYALGADHATALRREEERGYARGLRDARLHNHPWEPLNTRPESDDLIWLLKVDSRGNVIEGPRVGQVDDADWWDFWCYAEAPPFVREHADETARQPEKGK